MKKTLSLILAVLLVLIILPVSALARDYPANCLNIWINGVAVTTGNASNVLGDAGTPTVVYEQSSNTIILNNANLTKGVDRESGIYCAIYDENNNETTPLTIKLIGDNTICFDSDTYNSAYARNAVQTKKAKILVVSEDGTGTITMSNISRGLFIEETGVGEKITIRDANVFIYVDGDNHYSTPEASVYFPWAEDEIHIENSHVILENTSGDDCYKGKIILKDIEKYRTGSDAEKKDAFDSENKQAYVDGHYDYAEFMPGDKYTVSFDLNGFGDETPTDQQVKGGEKAEKPDTDPEEPGYIFTGWFKDPDCTEKWDFDTDTVNGDTVLYAGWERENSTTPFPTPVKRQKGKYEIFFANPDKVDGNGEEENPSTGAPVICNAIVAAVAVAVVGINKE